MGKKLKMEQVAALEDQYFHITAYSNGEYKIIEFK